MKRTDTLILQRVAGILAAVRPLRPEVRPPTERRLLEQGSPVSLTMRRRRLVRARGVGDGWDHSA